MKKSKDKMQELVINKYNLIKDEIDKSNAFWQLNFLGANYIGQIGEDFVKWLFKEAGFEDKNYLNQTIHSDYDLIINNLKIEVKTARFSSEKNFQFGGINTWYNFDYLFLLGLSNNQIYYRILKKSDIFYNHDAKELRAKSHFIKLDENNIKKLVASSPQSINFKFKATLKDLEILDDRIFEVLKSKFR